MGKGERAYVLGGEILVIYPGTNTNFGLKPNYELLGFSPTTNARAEAQLQTLG
jgi:hypothetical protein